MIKSKKSSSWLTENLAIIVLISIVIVISIVFFSKSFGKGATEISQKFDAAGDADNDNVINLKDKCPCVEGDIENDGCPYGHKPTEQEDKSCLKKS